MVTGGTGFLGSHTVVALLKAGHQVRLLVRSEQKMNKLFALHKVKIDDYVVGDVTDKDAVLKALEGCDAVIHTAAMVATQKKYADLVHRTNVDGTKYVIGQALEKGIRHIVHVSSITAIFDPDSECVDENSPPGKANNAYGRSKVECERYVRDLQAQGAPVVITYPTGVIGPLDPGFTEPLQGLKIFLEKLAIITSTGIQFVDVRDCADVNVAILGREPGPDRFALGGYYYPWAKLTDQLEALTGRRLFRLKLSPAVMHVFGVVSEWYGRITQQEVTLTREAVSYATRWSVVSNDKVEKELGFTFRDGARTMADTLQWMAQQGHLKKKHIGKLAEEDLSV
jgi:nucleoside-diphosphate-sugar epimerase